MSHRTNMWIRCLRYRKYFPELTDTDNNGTPDYLQTLISPSVSDEAVQDYADQALEELGVDSDGDSIPDADDTMDNTDSATDFMWSIG